MISQDAERGLIKWLTYNIENYGSDIGLWCSDIKGETHHPYRNSYDDESSWFVIKRVRNLTWNFIIYLTFQSMFRFDILTRFSYQIIF